MLQNGISIVIIGYNQSHLLPKVLKYVDPYAKFAYESIYIDSNSKDDSIEVASKLFDKVIKIDNVLWTTASMGRFLGSKFIEFSHVLFLDGDMTLGRPFIDFMNNLDIEKNIHGYVANTKNIFNNGFNIRKPLLNRKGYIRYHGGFCLYPATILNKVTWNPFLGSSEEIDFLIKVRAEGTKVLHIDEMGVLHFLGETNSGKTFERLLALFYPIKGHKRKFHGFRDLVDYSIKRKQFKVLLKYFHEPFIIFILNIISMFALILSIKLWISFTIVSLLIFLSVYRIPITTFINNSFLPYQYIISKLLRRDVKEFEIKYKRIK